MNQSGINGTENTSRPSRVRTGLTRRAERVDYRRINEEQAPTLPLHPVQRAPVVLRISEVSVF